MEKPEADGSSLARGMGVFSLGLGLTEIAAPALLARTIGISPSKRTSTALRIFGMREVVSGLGVLLLPRKSLPLWARLAGDAIDIAAIGWAARSHRTRIERLAAAFVAVSGAAVLDALAARRVSRANPTVVEPTIFSVTINKPPEEVYKFWRELSNLPRFMTYLESVTDLGNNRSRWVATLPTGPVEWEAEVLDDRPGERLAWQTLEGARFAHRGEVTFARAPGRNMTELRVKLELGIAGIPPNARLAKLLTKPQIKSDLRRLKQVLETGEIVRSDASIHKLPHPAQPSTERVEALPTAPGDHTPTAPKGGANTDHKPQASKPPANKPQEGRVP